ncbi:hypothetical protein ACFE04_012173 [Oxalis oulophora]
MSYIKNVSKEQETGYISSVGSWTRAKSDDIGVFSSSSNFTVQKCYAGNEYKDRNEVYAEQIDATQTNEEMIVTAHDELDKGSPDMKHVVSYGPWGGNGGMIFDDGFYTGVREIHLTRYGGIISFRACYDLNGEAVWGNKNGGTTGIRAEKVILDYPEETLTHISGFYGPTILRGPIVVKSLTFHTNKRKYGPYGRINGDDQQQQAIPFSSELNNSKNTIVVGFHGRKGWLVDSIGVHVLKLKPILSHYDSFHINSDQALNFFSSTTGIGKRLARSPTPWGGEGGKPWNDGVFNGIKKIYLVNGESAIHCIQIQYDKHGQSLWSARHGGGTSGTSKLIKLDYPDEYLTHISGCYGSLKENEQKIVVKSLTFYSNIQQKYGPFGEEKGTTFMMTSPKGKIVGLYGRNNSYLTAIGVHMQPTDHTCEKFGSIKTLIHKYISSR